MTQSFTVGSFAPITPLRLCCDWESAAGDCFRRTGAARDRLIKVDFPRYSAIAPRPRRMTPIHPERTLSRPGVSLPRWLAAVAVRAHPERRRSGLALLWAAERSAPLARRALP
jgi:hypothetical protein